MKNLNDLQSIEIQGIKYYATDCPGYYVSINGAIISFMTNKGVADLSRQPKFLKYNINGSGYCQIYLRYPGQQRKQFMVHRIVMNTFVGPRPENMVIDHIDRNKQNNCISNLRYVTISFNNSRFYKEFDHRAHNAYTFVVTIDSVTNQYDSKTQLVQQTDIERCFVDRIITEQKPWKQNNNSKYFFKSLKRIENTFEIELVSNKNYGYFKYRT